MLFNRESQTIKWVKPKQPKQPKLASVASFDAPAKPKKGGAFESDVLVEIDEILPQNALIAAIEEYGVPTLKGATPEQELIFFLKVAAEIEHGLMIQYLYAANGTTNKEMSRVISSIATEEMGHLLTVENILLAMNEKPYLGRYDSSESKSKSKPKPKTNTSFAPFPFSLGPLTKLVIAKFAACERPADDEITEKDQKVYNQVLAELNAHAMGVVPERVGLIYAKIYWLLRENDEPLKNPDEEEWKGFPVVAMKKLMGPKHHVKTYPVVASPLQGLEDDWTPSSPDVLVFTAETKEAARTAIAKISAQGEGLMSKDNSHFDRFLDIFGKAKQGTPIDRNIPVNPWYQGVPSTGGDEITNKDAVVLAKLADLLYELLLNVIALSIHPETTDMEERSQLASFSIQDIMVTCLRRIAQLGQTLPITDKADSLKFSQCYTLPQGSPEISAIKTTIKTVVTKINKLLEKADKSNNNLSIIFKVVLDTLKDAPLNF